MAQLQISGNVRIGYVYECEFGLFKKARPSHANDLATSDKSEALDNDYNYRIPNELVKRRAVVVIGKHGGQYIVVPVSSTKETHKKPHKEPEFMGIHVRLQDGDMPVTLRYTQGKDRWAKSNLVTTVDGGRLRDIYDQQSRQCIPAHAVSARTLELIRYGVLLSIGMPHLVPKSEEEIEPEIQNVEEPEPAKD